MIVPNDTVAVDRNLDLSLTPACFVFVGDDSGATFRDTDRETRSSRRRF